MEERNYKLYVHISPSNKRYYGITCKKRVQDRWDCGRGYYKNEHFTNAINKYGWENFQHIVLFDNLTIEEASLLEQMYIALYDTTNSKYGYNNSLGGEHPQLTEQTKNKISEAKKGKVPWMKGKHHTEESKNKISEAGKGRVPWNKGKPQTKELKKKLSESLKGKHHTKETKKKMSEARIGISRTEETKKKISKALTGKYTGKGNRNSKPLLMFNKSGEFIRRFDCVADANEYLCKPRSKVNIYLCATGNQETAYGYKWRYEEDYIKE